MTVPTIKNNGNWNNFLLCPFTGHLSKQQQQPRVTPRQHQQHVRDQVRRVCQSNPKIEFGSGKKNQSVKFSFCSPAI